MLVVQFVILVTVITGVIIFALHKVLIASTDGAVKRLNTETEAVRTKQSELNRKIKEVDEELARRKKEADELVKKMTEEAEEAAHLEREKLIKKAREESEEIITKAQRTKGQIRQDIAQEMELKTVDFAIQILHSVLSEKARGALDKQLLLEFMENLEAMDMDQVSMDVTSADVITAVSIDETMKDKFAKILKTKLNREIKIHASVDPLIGGGAILRFGSLAVDGSLQSIIREVGTAMKQKAEGA